MNKSIVYFWLLCIPTRILLSLIPIYIDKRYLFTTGLISLIPATSFLYLYAFHKRLNAFEASNGKTWWAKFRILHSLFWFAGAVLMIAGRREASIPLSLDVFSGIVLSLSHYLN